MLKTQKKDEWLSNITMRISMSALQRFLLRKKLFDCMYFFILATFPGLQQFIQSCIKECRKQGTLLYRNSKRICLCQTVQNLILFLYHLFFEGFVTTILGRRRLLPGIDSSDPAIRSHSERQAVNFVIQGKNSSRCLYT